MWDPLRVRTRMTRFESVGAIRSRDPPLLAQPHTQQFQSKETCVCGMFQQDGEERRGFEVEIRERVGIPDGSRTTERCLRALWISYTTREGETKSQ